MESVLGNTDAGETPAARWKRSGHALSTQDQQGEAGAEVGVPVADEDDQWSEDDQPEAPGGAEGSGRLRSGIACWINDSGPTDGSRSASSLRGGFCRGLLGRDEAGEVFGAELAGFELSQRGVEGGGGSLLGFVGGFGGFGDGFGELGSGVVGAFGVGEMGENLGLVGRENAADEGGVLGDIVEGPLARVDVGVVEGEIIFGDDGEGEEIGGGADNVQ